MCYFSAKEVAIGLNTLTHQNVNCVQLQVQIQKISDANRVQLEKKFTKNRVFKINASNFTASKIEVPSLCGVCIWASWVVEEGVRKQ